MPRLDRVCGAPKAVHLVSNWCGKMGFSRPLSAIQNSLHPFEIQMDFMPVTARGGAVPEKRFKIETKAADACSAAFIMPKEF